MKVTIYLNALLGFALMTVPIATAQSVPPLMNYQGRLTDEAGAPLPNGPYVLQFAFFDQAVGGSSVWQEQQTVSLLEGGFNVVLGTVNPALATVFTNANRFLQLTVLQNPAGSNVNKTILPRQQLLSSPYAIEAGRAGVAGVAETLDPAYVQGALFANYAGSRLGTVAHKQVFTSNGTWTAPTNLSSAFVIVWACGGGGGGGGGGGRGGGYLGGGGGGGGGSTPLMKIISVSPSASYGITIGAGGSGGLGGRISGGTGGAGANGQNGGTTLFDSHSFLGGRGGKGGPEVPNGSTVIPGQGGASNGPGGYRGNGGEAGNPGGISNGGNAGSGGGDVNRGGGGGGGGRGNGAAGGASADDPTVGSNAAANSGGGGGGGGGRRTVVGGNAGGNGGSGYLEIIWFAPQ